MSEKDSRVVKFYRVSPADHICLKVWAAKYNVTVGAIIARLVELWETRHPEDAFEPRETNLELGSE